MVYNTIDRLSRADGLTNVVALLNMVESSGDRICVMTG